MSNVLEFKPRPPRASREDRQRWDRGELVPDRITVALDLAGLHGPEVDVALGGAEPMVDMWEEGVMYPSWSQLLKLAMVTGFPVSSFFIPVDLRQWYDIRRSTFICGPHRRDPVPPMPKHLPVTEFTKKAIQERKL